MQPWRMMLAGLVASCLGDLSYPVQNTAKSYPLDLQVSDNDRRLSDFTQACPRVRKNTKGACERCLSDEMCAAGHICHPSLKKCTDSTWNGTQVLSACPENADDFSTWSALCLYTCDEQTSPFACSRWCLNEDFPCKWVTDCHTPSDLLGMSSANSACLRPCADHDNMLQVELRVRGLDKYPTCAAAINRYGCTNQYGARMKQLCPMTCLQGECAWRCGRDEEAGTDGKKCWDLVLNEKYTCSRAISLGYDCHCMCGGAYFALLRQHGGPFLADNKYRGESVGLNITATANQTFDLSMSGEEMTITDVVSITGPRAKIVPKGADCRYANLAVGVVGLHCNAGTDMAGNPVNLCTIAPSLATPYLHRFTDIAVNRCGVFDICHCNHQCDTSGGWHHIGKVTVSPQTIQAGSVGKALPGCMQPVAEVDVTGPTTATDVFQNGLIETKLTIYAVVKQQYRNKLLHASKRALVAIVASHSQLLQKVVPEDRDVTASFTTRIRRLESFLSAAETRRLDNCSDDPVAFAEEAALVNVPYTSCAAVLASGVELNVMCSDNTLLNAIVRGCQKTCNACGAGPTPAPYTLPSTLQGHGINVDFQISVATKDAGGTVLARVNHLKVDPAPFVQRLFTELEDADVPTSELPPEMWATVVGEVIRSVLPDTTETTTRRPAGESSTSLALVLVGCLGGACFVGVLFVACGLCIHRHRQLTKGAGARVMSQTEVSEGGYRIKTKKWEIPAVEEEQPNCCDKLCRRLTCGLCFVSAQRKREEKKAALRKPQAWAGNDQTSNDIPLDIGCIVKLQGLIKRPELNGLTAEVMSGPDANGRYKVDLKVDVKTTNVEEHQEISVKAENIRVIEGGLRAAAQQVQVAPKPPGSALPPGTYRTAR